MESCIIRSFAETNKVQISRSIRMPQLHTLLHLHLAPIMLINGSSFRDLISGSRIGDFCCVSRGFFASAFSSASKAYRGSTSRRALILGWASYLDAFNSYVLHTWLRSVCHGHDNWYTKGVSFPVLSY
ncbi:hypothetical protein KP509_13G053200 [Ceratopteris richardii]|uniref:Uncharacterized protein n=1 Tax=Ceratopteris richardii TaxID=49495 RepID=A0A8T2TL56_CERRI|nr:hypothetical protein KP509_13G053200 [Ceratopteris richardii]